MAWELSRLLQPCHMSLSQQGPRGLRCAEAFDKSQLFRGPNKLRTGQLGCPGGGRAADPFFPLQKTNTVFPGHVTHGRTLDFLPLARLEEKQEGRTGPAGPCALLGQVTPSSVLGAAILSCQVWPAPGPGPSGASSRAPSLLCLASQPASWAILGQGWQPH